MGGLFTVKGSVVWRSRQEHRQERCNRNEFRASNIKATARQLELLRQPATKDRT